MCTVYRPFAFDSQNWHTHTQHTYISTNLLSQYNLYQYLLWKWIAKHSMFVQSITTHINEIWNERHSFHFFFFFFHFLASIQCLIVGFCCFRTFRREWFLYWKRERKIKMFGRPLLVEDRSVTPMLSFYEPRYPMKWNTSTTVVYFIIGMRIDCVQRTPVLKSMFGLKNYWRNGVVHWIHDFSTDTREQRVDCRDYTVYIQLNSSCQVNAPTHQKRCVYRFIYDINNSTT